MNENKFIMIKMNYNNYIFTKNNYQSIELVHMHNIKIIKPTFDYVRILNIKKGNMIKKLHLFNVQKCNINIHSNFYEDDETTKILNTYNNYTNIIKYYKKYEDDDNNDDNYIYNNFCNSVIKFNLTDYDFFIDFVIKPMNILVPLSP